MKKTSNESMSESELSALEADIIQMLETASDNFYEGLSKAVTKVTESPDADAWVRLTYWLRKARLDKRIRGSAAASSFVDLMYELVSDAYASDSVEETIAPLAEALHLDNQKRNARARNADERAWVHDEWKKYGRSPGGYDGNKSDFSRVYAQRLLNDFDVKVTVETIRDRWLKGL